MYESELKSLGLTDGEARAYSSLLKIGSSTVGPIAKESGVSYSKIYSVLQRLIEKGLASFSFKEKTKYFHALEPGRLEEYLDKKEQEIEKERHILKEIIPILKSISLKEKSTESEIFVGERGLMTAYDILMEKAVPGSTLMFFYVHNPEYDEKVYDFCYGRVNYNNKKIIPQLKRKKMKWIGIVNTENAKKRVANPSDPIIQRYTSLPLPGNIDVTDNSILISIWGSEKPLAILIQSEEVALNFKRYFDSLWNLAKN